MAQSLHPDHWGNLMRAALAGDAAAYTSLFEDLSRVLRAQVGGALRRAGQGNSEVEDIVQEALLAVHLKRHTWDVTRPFGPWVKAVTHYKLIDAMRRRRVHASIDELGDTIADTNTPSTDLGDAERLITQLPPRQQAIVRAISIEGKQPGHVAQALGMSEGALRVALHRALRQLAALYRSGE